MTALSSLCNGIRRIAHFSHPARFWQGYKLQTIPSEKEFPSNHHIDKYLPMTAAT